MDFKAIRAQDILTKLPDNNWNALAQPAIDAEVRKVEGDLKVLAGRTTATEKIAEGVALLHEITAFSSWLGDQDGKHSKMYSAWKEEFLFLRSMIPPLQCLTGADLMENVRERYANYGQWAIHYSTVRMTVTTFLVGLSWGIVALQWDKYSFVLCVAAWVVWVFTLILLFTFTYHTKKMLFSQIKLLKWLQTPDGKCPDMNKKWMKANGLPRKIFWYNISDFTVVACLIATVGFVYLTEAWALNVKNESVTLVVPGYRETNEVTNRIFGWPFPWQNAQETFRPLFSEANPTNGHPLSLPNLVLTPTDTVSSNQPSTAVPQATNPDVSRTNQP